MLPGAVGQSDSDSAKQWEEHGKLIAAPPQLNWPCLIPLGGGPSHPGGDFVIEPHRHACTITIAKYLEKQYDADVEMAVASARHWFNTSAAAANSAVGGPGVIGPRAGGPASFQRAKRLLVFDIDETLLCNIKGPSADWRRLQGPQGPASLREAQLRVESPPVLPMRALYRELWSAGYSIALITGRPEHARATTERNLEAAGYGRQCQGGSGPGVRPLAHARRQLQEKQGPCYMQLELRGPSDAGTSATVYKGSRRRRLVDAGFSIIASFGDQFSDLSGEAPAAASFKLPNPVYYIL